MMQRKRQRLRVLRDEWVRGRDGVYEWQFIVYLGLGIWKFGMCEKEKGKEEIG